MLQHISKTRTMRKFNNASRHHQQEEQPQAETGWSDCSITKRQLWYIRLLASQQSISIQNLNNTCYRQYGADLATMTRPDASSVIKSLKRSLNRQYKPFH